jgi:hypothetical protein
MKYILWDFDGTLGYRDGNWSDTLHSILLLKNSITNISINTIKPYLTKGFTWHNSEKSNKELFGNKTWWEYYEEYFSNIFIELGVEEATSKNIPKGIKKNIWIK